MTMQGASASTCVVEAGTGRVREGGVLTKLTCREAEIAVALASQRYPIPVRALGAVLYPDRDEPNATNMVKVYVFRLRRRLGREFIVNCGGGYVLGPRVVVDIVEAQEFVSRLSRRVPAFENVQCEHMLQIARALRSEPSAATRQWTWHEPIALLSRRLGHDLAMLLARSALERGALDETLAIARELTYEDPCDEEAWELLIRTQLRLGQRVAARLGFRSYATALANELDLRPSPSIQQLVEAS